MIHFLICINQEMTGQLLWKKQKTHVHQPSACHPYDSCAYARAKVHRRESTDTDAWLRKHTRTPPHSSKVHLSRWQLDSCWGVVCQAESLAWLAGARTSWETSWHTLRGCSATTYVCVCVFVFWMCNFSKHPAAAWQGPAPLQFLPVLGRSWLGREQPILSGFQSTSNVHTASASTCTPFLLCSSSHIWVHRHLFTSWCLPRLGRNILYAFPSKQPFSCVHWKCVGAIM